MRSAPPSDAKHARGATTQPVPAQLVPAPRAAPIFPSKVALPAAPALGKQEKPKDTSSSAAVPLASSPAFAKSPIPSGAATGGIIVVEYSHVRVLGRRPVCPVSPDGELYRAAMKIVAHDDLGAAVVMLEEYYGVNRPATAAAVLGLPENHELADYPPLAAVLPWEQVTPSARLLEAEADVARDMGELGITDGCSQFGPVSRRRLRQEVRELHLSVLRNQGKLPSTVIELPIGYFVDDDRSGNWIFVLRAGAYQCAARAAMGYSGVALRICADPVLRSQAAQWYGVQSGLFTEAEALGIFDRLVVGALRGSNEDG